MAIITARELFTLYVSCGLCTSTTYLFDDLSIPMQARWQRMANELNAGGDAHDPR